jgi:uncharacterized protein (DUF2062 family)
MAAMISTNLDAPPPPVRYRRPGFIRRMYYKHVLKPIRTQIRRGVSHKRMSHSMSMGVVAAVYPQIGFTTAMAVLLGFIFRLNYAAVIAVKWLLSPLQFVFMIPFLRLGELFLGIEPFHMSLDQIIKTVYSDPIGSFRILGLPLLHAIFGWIICCVLLYPFIYAVNYILVGQISRALREARDLIAKKRPDGKVESHAESQ